MHALPVAAAATALLWAAGAAGQAVTTIGSSAAQACYEAARHGRTAQAELGHCDQALQGALSASDLVATHVNRGILHALRGDHNRAMLDYDKALALDPTEAEAYLNKGLLLLRRLDNDRQALALIDLALANKTTKPAIAYFARAVAHEGLGQAGAAYRDFRQAAALAPNWEAPTRELRRFRKGS